MDLEWLVRVLQRKCLLTFDEKILVGVSGGPDSLCLLDVLHRLHLPVLAAHFDHHLRPESSQDAQVVRSVAARLNVPFILGQGDVAAFAQSEKLSLEEAARILRYRFLFAEARRHAAQAVAVGHTADDQVETVLMHLLRGAGLSGLKGMDFSTILPGWDESIPLVRPLLFAWREDTLAYCQAQSLPYVMDASNQDTTFFRNRLRHELVPFLSSYNPQIKQTLWRTSQVLTGEDSLVQNAITQAWQSCLHVQRADHLTFYWSPLRHLSRPLQRGVVRRAIAQLRPQMRDVDFEAVERAVDFIEAPPRTGQMDWIQGLVIALSPTSDGEPFFVLGERGAFDLPDWSGEHGPQLAQAEEQPLSVPGQVTLSSGWQIYSNWIDLESDPAQPIFSSSPWEAWLDAAEVMAPLHLRRPHPGDRFQPLGMGAHTIKLSDFWINEKLPRRLRSAWPLVCSAGRIIWVPGFRLADPFRLTASTRRALYLKLVRL